MCRGWNAEAVQNQTGLRARIDRVGSVLLCISRDTQYLCKAGSDLDDIQYISINITRDIPDVWQNKFNCGVTNLCRVRKQPPPVYDTFVEVSSNGGRG